MAAAVPNPTSKANDVLNTSDHLLEVSSEYSSGAPLTHHPSLQSAYESELQFDENTFQHETEPHGMSQIGDSNDYNNDGTDVEIDNVHTQSDREDNFPADEDVMSSHSQDDMMQTMKRDREVISSSPIAQDQESAGSDDEQSNPYSSYQQFHKQLSEQDNNQSPDHQNSDLLEFEVLEHEMEAVLSSLNDPMATNEDMSPYDSLKQYLCKTKTTQKDQKSHNVSRKSRRETWKSNQKPGAEDVTSGSSSSLNKAGVSSGGFSPSISRIPMHFPGISKPLTPRGSRSTTPVSRSHSRSHTPSRIPALKKSKSQNLTTTASRERVRSSASHQRPATVAVLSPSITRSSGDDARSGRRSVSADTSIKPSRIPSPALGRKPMEIIRRSMENLVGCRIPRSPFTSTSSLQSSDRQASPELRSEVSEKSSSSRPSSRLPTRNRSLPVLMGQGPSLSRVESTEPRKLQNITNKPSRIPSAKLLVTSATEITSQEEKSAASLDLSQEDGEEAEPGSDIDLSADVNKFIEDITLTQPHKAKQTANRSQSLEPIKADSSPRLSNSRLASPAKSEGKDKQLSLSQKFSQKKQRAVADMKLAERRALSEGRKDSPSQFGEARLLNDAIRALEGGRKVAEDSSAGNKEKLTASNGELSIHAPQTNSTMIDKQQTVSSWSPSLPEGMGNNSKDLSSTWTSIGGENNTNDTDKTTNRQTQQKMRRSMSTERRRSSRKSSVEEDNKSRESNSLRKSEEMPHTEPPLPGAPNTSRYALPTKAYWSKYRAHRQDSQDGSSASEMADTKRKTRRHRRDTDQSQSSRKLKTCKASAALDNQSENPEEIIDKENEELVKQLQIDFDDLLSKYALAEVTIDQLRLGAKLNMYTDPAIPSHALTITQPNSARSATTLQLPNGASSSRVLNNSGSRLSLHGLATQTSHNSDSEKSPKSNKPLTEPQRSLKDNILHLQEQVSTFITGTSNPGQILNLKPEIHHQLYEALEQSQATLQQQLNEEKRLNPEFDADNHLAGCLHQVRMTMDDHMDKLPQILPPHPKKHPQNLIENWNSDDEAHSLTASSLASSRSGSNNTQKMRSDKSSNTAKQHHRKSKSRSESARSRSCTDRRSSTADDITSDIDADSVRNVPPTAATATSKTTSSKPYMTGGASSSSLAGSEPHPSKRHPRIQGSSDSGFIGSEEGKSPNTPTDRHASTLATIQSQAESNSVLESPRPGSPPDLSEERTAEWALRHKIEMSDLETPLPEPPKHKRSQSRSSRKSARSDRSHQSSVKSEALQSIKTEIEKLRGELGGQRSGSPVASTNQRSDRKGFGQPLKATYKLPDGYQALSSPPHHKSFTRSELRNSDLDLSEVEGRGYTPNLQTSRYGNHSEDTHPSSDRYKPEHHSGASDKQQMLHPLPLSVSTPRHQIQPSQTTRLHKESRLYDDRSDLESTARGPSPPHHMSQFKPYTPPHTSRNPRIPNTTDESYLRPKDDGHQHRDRRTPSEDFADNKRFHHPHPPTQPMSGEAHRHGENPGPSSLRSYLGESPYNRQPSPSQKKYSNYRSSQQPSKSHYQSMQEHPYSSNYSRESQTNHPYPSDPTMPELNTRDLNQTTLPAESTFHSNYAPSRRQPDPTAMSTPHVRREAHQQPITEQQMTSYNQSDFNPPVSQRGHKQPGYQHTYQPNPTLQQPNQPHPTYQQHSQSKPIYQQHSQPQPSYSLPQYSLPNQSQTSYPAHTNRPYEATSQAQPAMRATELMNTYPAGPVVSYQPVFTPQQMPVSYVQQSPALVHQPVTQPLGTTLRHHVCPSCSGRGVLATSHHCSSCGSILGSIATVTGLATHLSSALTLTNHAASSTPVIVPVTNNKSDEAYLTQKTGDGSYVTQPVNVVSESTQQVSVRSPEVILRDLSPARSGSKTRYYVREYGALTSDSEPEFSRSRRRRTNSSSSYRSKAIESLDDLESSLRDARKSADVLKQLSKGMRKGLQKELMKSSRKSVNASWNL